MAMQPASLELKHSLRRTMKVLHWDSPFSDMLFCMAFIWWHMWIPRSTASHSNHSVAILEELSFLNPVSSLRLVN